MKHSFLKLAAGALTLGLGVSLPAQAQNSAVNNAILSLKAGPGQYDKALTSINQAVENEKTKGSAKAWFTRGDVYYTLLDPSTQALYAKSTASMQPGEALQKAAESYKKALELDGPTGEYGKQVPERLKNLYGLAFNDGVKFITAGKTTRRTTTKPSPATAWPRSWCPPIPPRCSIRPTPRKPSRIWPVPSPATTSC